jgi:hypothetical protein
VSPVYNPEPSMPSNAETLVPTSSSQSQPNATILEVENNNKSNSNETKIETKETEEPQNSSTIGSTKKIIL